jgi:crotonobetaine/carnitine-CoA ligase
MLPTWGSTETGATGAGADPRFRGDREPGYLGKPYAEAEIAAFDPAGRRLPAGSQGELRLRHRHIMRGYLNEPEITASTVVDGWVCTGDLGVVDAAGDVHYRGRIKTMIKRAGENISPGEVEAAINQHPAVYESLVFGVPDAIRKEEVAAVVSLSAGAKCSEAELIQFLATRMSKAKLPRFLEIIDTPLPRLSVGKIDRPSVVKRFAPATFWDARASKNKAGNSTEALKS